MTVGRSTNAIIKIAREPNMVSINAAIGVDLHGNIWADSLNARQIYSGVGGQPDFIRALNDRAYGTPIIAIKSITDKGESKIARMHPPGISLTASAYDGVVIVTEYGIADLRELTSGEKAMAIASIAHPKFRDEFLRSVYEDPLFTKPFGGYLDKTPNGVCMYKGGIQLAEKK